ncbi:hypothetical protein RJ641_009479 [Dillenia turbinata]|uniref:Sulfotransferase n=1 Tax=Dillenia turbinata TaxID=194707 RepID=A0AAN8VCK0_9MAGN
MKRDTFFHTKKLAEFMGFPFSLEEEKEGVAQQVIDLCSLQNLSDLEVNKTGFILLSVTTCSLGKERLVTGKII